MKEKQSCLIVAIALIAGLIGGIISSQFFVGQPVFAEKKPNNELRVKTIKTQNLILENEAGEIRAFFNLQKDDSPLLMMFGKTSKSGESITVAIDLNTRDGAGTINLHSRDGGSINLSLEGKEGVSIKLNDAKGNTRAVLGSETTETIGTGAITKNPPSSLTLYNKKGRVIWSAP